jgi:formate--tetrahydrofolate ligase
MKGGAAGGGYAQVVPMEDINLHFTGDFHAIGAAHNLLSALIDNHIHWGNKLEIDTRRIVWKRVADMNDRALRSINCGLGGPGNGFPRQDGYDITVASEVMAIFCLATDLDDLKTRLDKIVVAYTRDHKPIHASEILGTGAMSVLLKDALAPNLVQTLENNPAIIHGGPFANIAHGCNSVIATKAGLKMADYVVTEAGFGADLGAEKFFDIKCRAAGLAPDASVIVATTRALKMHGGVTKDNLDKEDLDALQDGCCNLVRHIENVKSFGVPVVVGINRFTSDTDAEIALIKQVADANGVKAIECTHWADGGAGTEELAKEIASIADSGAASFAPLYPDDMPIWDKIKTVATRLYRADDIIADQKIRDQIRDLQDTGYGHLPVCIAKTQYSFSTDPNLKGAPSEHVVALREVRLSAGAGFIVVVCGDIMTMPGLPRVPAANSIAIDDSGQVTGLF